MNITIFTNLILVSGLLCAVVTDLRSRRISNRLTYSSMLLGLLLNGLGAGWSGLGHSGLGWLLAVGLMLLPFAMGATGAGDVKLLAAIGALKGPEFVFQVALYGSLAGGVLALIYLVKERRVGSTLRYIAYGWLGALRSNGPKAGAIPYAPAIAAGALLAFVSQDHFAL